MSGLLRFALILIALTFFDHSSAQWQQVTSGGASEFIKNGQFLFAGATQGVIRSSDHGQSWASASSGLPVMWAGQLAWTGSSLFVGMDNGQVFRSTDDGENWIARTTGLPTSTRVFGLDYVEGALWAGYEYGGAYKSTNEGLSWAVVPGLSTNLSAFDFFHAWGKLYVCTSDGVYLSTDGGSNWIATNAGLPGDRVVLDIDTLGSLLVVSLAQGVYRSTNQGASWTSISDGLGWTNSLLTIHGILFAASNVVGIFSSSDQGDSWTDQNLGSTATNSMRLFVDGPYMLVAYPSAGIWRRPLAQMLPGDHRPRVTAVQDVPNDQGGQVTVFWLASDLDVPPAQTVIEYSVWRGVRPSEARADWNASAISGFTSEGVYSALRACTYLKWPMTTGGLDTLYWEYLGSNPARYFTGYSYTAPTPSDSGPLGNSLYYFCVLAQSPDPFVFWASNVDSGYSIDNLAPLPPGTVASDLLPGPAVRVHWLPNSTNLDVGYYEVHRDTLSGFTPSMLTMIGHCSDSLLTDQSPLGGTQSFYRVVAVDVHGNRSAPSIQAGVEVCPTLQYGVVNGWNLVSVPLSALNYATAALFPTATSSAFAYEGGYVPQPTLENGPGYWLKFGTGQTVPVSGFLRDRDTIEVGQGWNLVGSVSYGVQAGEVASDPPGIIISPFFGYGAGGYHQVSTIEPARGYWVKVSGTGLLLLHGHPAFNRMTED